MVGGVREQVNETSRSWRYIAITSTQYSFPCRRLQHINYRGRQANVRKQQKLVAFDVRTKIYSAPSLGPIPIGPLPLVGALYSFLIWPVIWAITEEVTYLGYVLPRLKILTGRMSIAFVMVVFFVGPHCAMPLRLDFRFMLWRSIHSLPVVTVLFLKFSFVLAGHRRSS